MLLHKTKSPRPTQRASEPGTAGLQHLQRPSGQHGQATAPARAPAAPMHKARRHGTAGTHTTAGTAMVGRYTCVCVCVCVHVQKQTHSDMWCGRTRTHAYVGVCVYLQVRACPPYICCSPGARWLPGAVCRASHMRWAGWVQCCASAIFLC